MGGDSATRGQGSTVRPGHRTPRRGAPPPTRPRWPRLRAAVARLPLGVRQPDLLRLTLITSALALAWFVVRLLVPFGHPLLGWIPVPLAPVLAVIASARVVADRGLPDAARRVWRGLAIGSSAILVSVFTLMYDFQRGPAAGTSLLTNALFLTALLAVLWAVLRLPVRQRSRHEWFTVCLDIGIVLVATGLVIWYGTTWQDTTANPSWWWLMVLFACLGVIVAIKMSLTGFTGMDQSSMRLLACSVLVGALSGTTMPLLATRPDLNNVMMTLPLVFTGVIFAAEAQRRAPQRQLPAARRRRRPLPFSLLPYVAIAATDAILVATTASTSSAARIMIMGSVAITALVIARQMIAFRDNRRYQDQLAYQASHDELTGLANRSLFMICAEAAVETGAPGTVAVVLVDLDDFKTVNDRLGHSVGDALLVAVSARLREPVHPGDIVARLGGDEFGLLLTGLPPGEGSMVAEQILAGMTQPVTADGHHLLVQASIGLADNTVDSSAADLLRCADIAMYAAKELGKNRYAHYDSELEARTEDHAQLAAALSQALERDELHLLYQPIVDLATHAVVGVEALVRWQHPRDGLVSPVRFIPVAERTGLIVPLGEWVLRTACEQASDWQRRLGDRAPLRMTVNVSARQLLDPEFAHVVAGVLADTGLDPAGLTMEITETAVFGGGRALDTVSAVHALGVSVALDDFGTGHSSLGLLRTCPVDILKVDKSFIDGINGTAKQEAIAISIIGISQALGMRTIAEGVETAAQAQRLYEMGYRLAQGFHFARPMPAAEVEKLLPDTGCPPFAQPHRVLVDGSPSRR
ncbi:MAG TPA: EAL domain-containing protein [Catenuloplanes sp.]